MGVSFLQEQDKPFVADTNGTNHIFSIDKITGLALPIGHTTGLALPIGHTMLVANTKTNATNAIADESKAPKENPDIVELDSKNFGAPPKNSGIIENPEIRSDTEPQAYSDMYGNWLYNAPGSIKLAEVCGRTLPNIEQLITAINTNPDNFYQPSCIRKAENFSFEDYEHWGFWSSTLGGNNSALGRKTWGAFLNQHRRLVATRGEHYNINPLFVRFIVEK